MHASMARGAEPEPVACPQRRPPALRRPRDRPPRRGCHHDVRIRALEGKGADTTLGGVGGGGGGSCDVLAWKRHGVDSAGDGLAREAGEVRVDGRQMHDGPRAVGSCSQHRVKQPHSTSSRFSVALAGFHG